MPKILNNILLILFLIFNLSCASHSSFPIHNPLGDEYFQKNYLNQKFITKQRMLYTGSAFDGEFYPKVIRYPEYSRAFKYATVDDYLQDKSTNHNWGVIGVVPKGSIIKVLGIIRRMWIPSKKASQFEILIELTEPNGTQYVLNAYKLFLADGHHEHFSTEHKEHLWTHDTQWIDYVK